jgi:hypothetical protein
MKNIREEVRNDTKDCITIQEKVDFRVDLQVCEALKGLIYTPTKRTVEDTIHAEILDPRRK